MSIFLSVSGVSSGVFASSDLLDFEFGSFDFGFDDFGGDGGPIDHRLSDRTGSSSVGQQHSVELDRLTGFGVFAVVDGQFVTSRNAILVTSVGNDSEHVRVSAARGGVSECDRGDCESLIVGCYFFDFEARG